MNKIASLLFLTVFCLYGWSYETEGNQTIMKLDDLLALVKNNKEIKMAEFERQMRSFEHEQTNALDFGNLDLSIQGLRSDHAGAVFAMKLNEREVQAADLSLESLNYPDARSSFESKLTFTLPLYTGKKITAYKEMTKKLMELSVLDQRSLLLQKVFQVKKGYYGILLIEDLIAQIEEIKTNTLFLRKSVNQMQTEGFATKTDLMQIDARIAEINSLKNQLQTNRELAMHFLRFLTSSRITGLQRSKDDVKFKDMADIDILKQNPDIKKAKTAIEIKKEQLTASSSGFLPQVGLIAEYGSNDEHLFGNFSDHDYYMAGIGAKWNLFSGGATKNAVSKAKVDLLKQGTALSYAKEGLLLKADEIRTRIKNAEFKLVSLSEEKKYKKNIFENYKESHKEQRASMNDVLIQQSKYIEVLMKIEKNRNQQYEEIFKFETLTDGEKI